MESIKLNNGIDMPLLGYGVYQISPDECEHCVSEAIGVGYRLIDTAQAYYNEEGVGRAIRRSNVPRSEIFLTTKIWITHAGDEKAAASIDESLRKLRTDYVDLLLVHQPFSDYYGTYRAMEKALKDGKARAIGVSNFYPDSFVDIAENMEVVSAVNQLRTNVFLQQHDSEKEMNKYGARIMAWEPLMQASDELFGNVTLRAIAENHRKTVAQVALRYLVQRGIIAIPKSSHTDRMRPNLEVFDFTLTDAEMQSLLPLDREPEFSRSHRNPERIHFWLNYDKQFNPERRR
ncbi:MAG: aldo/keto reductase [Paraprevotella sp.]|nr:aldo/keto reductase [Paraprevotella sp.]